MLDLHSHPSSANGAGGVMLARSYRDVGYFDRAIAELKRHFNRLLRPATPARRQNRQRKRGKSNA